MPENPALSNVNPNPPFRMVGSAERSHVYPAAPQVRVFNRFRILRYLRKLAFATLPVMLVTHALAQGGVPTSTLPGEAVGSSSPATLVPVTIPAASTVTGYEIFGDGIQNSEFRLTNGGSCQTGYFASGSSCTMAVVFSPKYAGVRRGAIVATGSTLVGQNPTPLDATSFFSGTGQAAQGLFSSPFSYPLFAWGSSVAPLQLNQSTNAFAVDGSGNIFAGETAPLGPGDNQVYKVAGSTVTPVGPTGTTSYGSYSQTTHAITCVAVDAGGTVYFADQTDDRITRIQPDGSWYQVFYFDYATYGSVYLGNCGIDANGNLLLANFDRGFVRVNLQTLTASTVATADKPANNLSTDAAGNVYFMSNSNSAGGTNSVTEYSASGKETTVSLPFWQMSDVRSDTAGNLYIVGETPDTRNNANPWGIYEVTAGSTTLLPVVTNLPEGGYLQIAPNGDLYYLQGHSATMTRYARSQGSLSFQPEPVGSTSSQSDVIITNNGNLPLNISGIVADAGILWTGSDTTCTTSTALAPNDTCAIGVQFQPAVNGPYVGNVYVTDDDPNFANQQKIVVQGSTPTQTQTITFPPIATSVHVGDSANLAATSTSGSPITYDYSGPATLSGSTLNYTGAGTVTVTATQPGNSTYQAAQPLSQTITVQSTQAATTTSLTVKGSATYGAAMTLSALVTPANGNAVPTGSVTFQAGSIGFGTTSLNSSGVATVTTTLLPAGTDTVVASYAGDSNNQPSASAAQIVTVSPAATTLTLTASASAVDSGSPVTLAAAVGHPVGAAAPTGTVTFQDGSAVVGTATLNGGGTATLTISSLGVGSHSLTASYSGDVDYQASSANTVSLTVNPVTLATTTTITSSVATATAGSPVTFLAAVSHASGSAAATGTVTFFDGSLAIGSASVGSNGSGSFSTSSLAVGSHSITAQYGGDSNYAASKSTISASVTITTVPTTTGLVANGNTIVTGSTLTLTVTVGAASGTPGGTVTLNDGTAQLGNITLDGGTGTFSTSALSIGSHNITATYAGEGIFGGSSSPSLTIVVTGTPAFSVTANPSSLTIPSGSSGSTALTFTPTNGYTGTIQLTCGSSLPLYASCAFSPASVSFTAASQAPQSVTLTINTQATNTATAQPLPERGSFGPLAFACAVPLLLLGVARRRRGMFLVALAALAIATGVLTGCGGASPPPTAKTPPGSYSVPISLSDGSSTQALNLSVTVQ